jgi:hypothetical protein
MLSHHIVCHSSREQLLIEYPTIAYLSHSYIIILNIEKYILILICLPFTYQYQTTEEKKNPFYYYYYYCYYAPDMTTIFFSLLAEFSEFLLSDLNHFWVLDWVELIFNIFYEWLVGFVIGLFLVYMLCTNKIVS